MTAASHGPMPPRSIAAWKIKNLAQNPPVGGMPASDTMNAVIATARTGARRREPGEVGDQQRRGLAG